MMELMFDTTDRLKYYVNELLSESTVEITFIKSDGSTRVMKATKDHSVIPAPNPVPTVNNIENGALEAVQSRPIRKQNPGVVIVWDTEKLAWRSITLERIKKITTCNMTFDITIGDVSMLDSE